jgi:hypothetical protein
MQIRELIDHHCQMSAETKLAACGHGIVGSFEARVTNRFHQDAVDLLKAIENKTTEEPTDDE